MTYVETSHDPSMGWNQEKWTQWIAEARRERERAYRASPGEIVGAYFRETRQSSDYHGRELLELLQSGTRGDLQAEFEKIAWT